MWVSMASGARDDPYGIGFGDGLMTCRHPWGPYGDAFRCSLLVKFYVCSLLLPPRFRRYDYYLSEFKATVRLILPGTSSAAIFMYSLELFDVLSGARTSIATALSAVQSIPSAVKRINRRDPTCADKSSDYRQSIFRKGHPDLRPTLIPTHALHPPLAPIL